MKNKNHYHSYAICQWVLIGSALLLFACSRPSLLVGIGTDGKYQEAREEITRRRGGNLDNAIVKLEDIVREDPAYRDSLTLLGRAYYAKARYRDARAVLQRAVAVNRDDEIAWLVLGATFLRTGEDAGGLKAVQGGLTLLNKVSTEGYRGYQYWDRSGRVKSGLRRAVFVALKGTEEKENLIASVENVLRSVDEEEWYQQVESTKERRLLAN